MNMRTKNIYYYPVKKTLIKKLQKDSPAHRKYTSKVTGAAYDLTHAVDLLCDNGTEILAACDGQVIAMIDHLTRNWNKRKPPSKAEMPEDEQDGNYVIIKHRNEEFSIYSHMGYKQVKVKKDDPVKSGQVLGYCGNTGWSIIPHLHFMVFRFLRADDKSFESLEIQWQKSNYD